MIFLETSIHFGDFPARDVWWHQRVNKKNENPGPQTTEFLLEWMVCEASPDVFFGFFGSITSPQVLWLIAAHIEYPADGHEPGSQVLEEHLIWQLWLSIPASGWLSYTKPQICSGWDHDFSTFPSLRRRFPSCIPSCIASHSHHELSTIFPVMS